MSTLRNRVNWLERKQPDRRGGAFPAWELLAGERGLADRWLAERGYMTLVQAVVAGESAPLLMVFALEEWLAARGHADALAAVEAGETAPAGLEAELRERAECDRRQRVFACMEKALAAGELPDDADVQAVQG
jgi:hypothetical protein